ncbi:hypothetical protein DL93DRAFT_361779 [Clavulina sp. PMI_390]|nr:hypothetical protein DL93DRAFT_361779 [Clavulina sp. PMI_390]
MVQRCKLGSRRKIIWLMLIWALMIRGSLNCMNPRIASRRASSNVLAPLHRELLPHSLQEFARRCVNLRLHMAEFLAVLNSEGATTPDPRLQLGAESIRLKQKTPLTTSKLRERRRNWLCTYF